MPNGHDPLSFLAILCASYRFRYGEWPDRLQVSPLMLWGLASEFGEQNFLRVGEHLEIRSFRASRADPYDAELMAVSGDGGTMGWEEGTTHPKVTSSEELDRWLQLINDARSWLDVDLPEPQER